MRQTLNELLSPELRSYFTAVRAHLRGVVYFVAGVTVVAAAVALLLPQWYQSDSSVLPPMEGADSFGTMASLVQNAALSKIGLLSTQSPSDLAAEILRSRRLREDLVRTFDLQSVYGAKNMDVALRKLGQHVRVEVDKAGVVHVGVEDRQATRAADMANHLVAGLDRFNRETYSTRAKRVRLFLEERLADVSRRMNEAEASLTAYERTHKVVTTTESAGVSGLAGIMAERLNLQVRRAYVASFSREDSPALQEIDSEMRAFERELAKMPALKQEGARLALDAELQRRLFSLITAQYEDARVQEARDTPTITVLDPARPAQMRARPRRSLIVAVATLVSSVLALGWVWIERRRATTA
ncbi:MAG: hypothetical protein IT347_03520 [Candidatus Eisenbacteria bacterium]|nr:hypothetical protein [Candidatus Eisenbacteria bacterium]